MTDAPAKKPPPRHVVWLDTIHGAQISAAEKALCVALLARIDARKNRDTAWPSNERLVRDTGFSLRTIQRARASLTERGVLRLVEQGHIGHDGSPRSAVVEISLAALIALGRRRKQGCHSDTHPPPQSHPGGATVAPQPSHRT